MRLFITWKSDGHEWECSAEKLDEYFLIIESLTGLDRAMASMILRSGQTIDHPSYSFRSEMHSTAGGER